MPDGAKLREPRAYLYLSRPVCGTNLFNGDGEVVASHFCVINEKDFRGALASLSTHFWKKQAMGRLIKSPVHPGASPRASKQVALPDKDGANF